MPWCLLLGPFTTTAPPSFLLLMRKWRWRKVFKKHKKARFEFPLYILKKGVGIGQLIWTLEDAGQVKTNDLKLMPKWPSKKSRAFRGHAGDT